MTGHRGHPGRVRAPPGAVRLSIPLVAPGVGLAARRGTASPVRSASPALSASPVRSTSPVGAAVGAAVRSRARFQDHG
ncbi:MAG: hypothetical protein ABR922_25665, partial [Streptosporangiaceae bacterium]